MVSFSPDPLLALMRAPVVKLAELEQILDQGANLDYQDSEGKTALMIAAGKGYRTAARILIERGASLDITDNKGCTALWHAAFNGNINTSKLLLEKGADPAIIDNQGRPLQYYLQATRHYNWKEIKNLINEAVSSRLKELSSLIKRTKLTTHAFEIEGTGKIFGKTFPFEGGLPEISAATMAKSCAKFDELKELSALLQSASTHRERRREDTNPQVIFTGFSGHAISILIWDDLFITCDRGGSEPSLSIKRFDPKKFDAETVQLLSDARELPESEYKKLMKHTLPEKLSFSSDKETVKLKKLAKLPLQIVGNCSWAATEGIVKCYLVLKDPKSAEGLFMKWQLTQQMDLFEKYLKDPIDTAIVHHSFNILWIAQKKYPEAIDKARLTTLEAKYTKGKTPAELRLFRINKVLSTIMPFLIPLRLFQAIIGALALFFTTGRISLPKHYKERLPLK